MGRHLGERAGAGADDHSEAQMDDADAGIDGGPRGCLPLLADFGEEASAGSGGFVQATRRRDCRRCR